MKVHENSQYNTYFGRLPTGNEVYAMKSISELFEFNEGDCVNSLINALPFGIVILDEHNIIKEINKKFIDYFHSDNNIIGQTFSLQDFSCEQLEESKDSHILLAVKNKNEIVSMQRKPIFNKNQQLIGNVLLFQGFSDQQSERDMFQQIANLDYLTKLSNRRGLYQYYDTLDKDQSMHFLFLDIDNFKIVNDVYGHSSGDELLVMVSSQISKCLPDTFISRIGGDEFVMILSGNLSEEEVTNRARKILTAVSSAEYRKDILSTISISIGIILDQKLDCKLDDILYKCDSAMYRAKKNGKNQFIIFNSMEQEVQERKTIEEEMHQALANGEFVIYLQPKMNMLTSRLYGAEALVRWQHPKHGLRFPDKFISIFENTGFIVNLDMYVFEEVCKLKSKWKNEVFKDMIISVNMSRLHFYREDFVNRLISIINRYEVKASELEIEITESIFLKNGKDILDTVSKLKKAGFFISVDDFGSGYSSLNMLKDIPADILKIDREFLQLSEDDEKSKTVVKNVITMGKDLKLQLIAEGVETLDQVLFLTSCGCELAQGYYYSKPIPIEDFQKFASKHMTLNEKTIRFSFKNNLWDDNTEFEGSYIGDNLQYCEGVSPGYSAIYLPGGNAYRNVIKLPNSVICSESYTISMWAKSETSYAWASLFFTEFDNGFSSLVPVAWEGTSVYRIKDGRDVNGWYDTSCCSLMKNEWIYLTVTYDAKSEIARYYSNGRQAGYREQIPPLRVARQVLLGGDIYQKSYKGYICDFTICDRAKSAQEIWNMYLNYIEYPSF